MSIQIRLDGTWLATIGGYSPPTFSSTADAGSEQASWDMTLGPNFTHPSMRAGKVVELKAGPSNVWSGTLADPEYGDDGKWSFSAIGLAGEGKSYLCFDGSGNASSTPDEAIDEAISRGMPWTRPASLSSVPFAESDPTDALNYVTDLLDAWALTASERWLVDPDKQVLAAVDPTVPTWYMTPGSARLGTTDEDYASSLFVRYKTSVGGYATEEVEDATAAATRRREYALDASKLGVISSGKATDTGEGALARGKARYSLTQPFTVSASQLTTPGGQPAFLPFVRGGQMVRIHGARDEQGTPLPYYDFIIGRVEYTDGETTIQIAAANLAERNLSDILSLVVDPA